MQEETTESNHLEESEKLKDSQIFTEIWFNPRKVFRYLNEKQYDEYTVLLLILSGIVNAFGKAQDEGYGENLDFPILLVYCIILGGFFGWIGSYIYSYIIKLIGNSLNGKAETKEILRVFAHSSIPSILALFLVIFEFYIYGESTFKVNQVSEIEETYLLLYEIIIVIVSLTLGIWSIVLLVVGISEIQQFSKWKAFANIFLPALVIIVIAIVTFVTTDLMTW